MQGVSSGNAMSLGAFNACVCLIADSIASLPGATYRKSGSTRVLVDPPPRVFLDSPYPGLTWFDWLWMVLESLLVTGNAFCYVTARDKFDRPTALMPLHPDVLKIDMEPSESFKGWLDPIYQVGGKRVPASDIVHIRRYPLSGAVLGMSVVQKAAAAIGLGLAAERFGLRYFKDSASPSSVLETDQTLDPTAAKETLRRWVATHGGRRLPAVLSGGLKWRPISISPNESQFLETRSFQRSDIAMWFRVPPHMIGDTQKSTTWGCLPGDALVATTTGPTPIKNVAVGDEVWSFDGTEMLAAKVTGTTMNGYKPLLTVKTAGRELRLTANHRVPVLRYGGLADGRLKGTVPGAQGHYIAARPSGSYQVRIRRQGFRYDRTFKTLGEATAARDAALAEAGIGGDCGWQQIELPAGEIRTGDYVLVPHGMADGTGKATPDHQELTVGRMEFLGLYLGDGSRDKGRIEIAHGEGRDGDHIPHYRQVIEREFGVAAYTDPRGTRTRFSSPEAIELIESGFTGTAHTKRLPGWVFRLDQELQLALLRGYLDSDGSVQVRTHSAAYPSISYASANKLLLEDIRLLCIQLGIPVGIVHVGRAPGPMTIEGRTYLARAKYQLTLTGDELRRIGSNSPHKAEHLARSGGRRRQSRYSGSPKGNGSLQPDWSSSTVVAHRVLAVTRDAIEVPVYDIEVAGPAHYVADGVIVHNSGIEQMSIGFVKFTLKPWLTCIEQALSQLLPRGQYFKFNIDGLLRGDVKTRWEAYQLGRNIGVYSANDICELEDRPPIGPEGDIRLQPVNYAPLGWKPEAMTEPAADEDPEDSPDDPADDGEEDDPDDDDE